MARNTLPELLPAQEGSNGCPSDEGDAQQLQQQRQQQHHQGCPGCTPQAHRHHHHHHHHHHHQPHHVRRHRQQGHTGTAPRCQDCIMPSGEPNRSLSPGRRRRKRTTPGEPHTSIHHHHHHHHHNRSPCPRRWCTQLLLLLPLLLLCAASAFVPLAHAEPVCPAQADCAGETTYYAAAVNTAPNPRNLTAAPYSALLGPPTWTGGCLPGLPSGPTEQQQLWALNSGDANPNNPTTQLTLTFSGALFPKQVRKWLPVSKSLCGRRVEACLMCRGVRGTGSNGGLGVCRVQLCAPPIPAHPPFHRNSCQWCLGLAAVAQL